MLKVIIQDAKNYLQFPFLNYFPFVLFFFDIINYNLMKFIPHCNSNIYIYMFNIIMKKINTEIIKMFKKIRHYFDQN